MNTYPVGANVRFSVNFKEVATGAYVDPTTVIFKILTPETGQVAANWSYLIIGSIARTAVGFYYADYTCNYPGDWYYRWEAAGSHIGAYEKYCCIMETVF